MGYSIDDLVDVLSVLVDEGVRFVIIGDTVVQLALRRGELVGDVDVFALEPSPLAEEERYISIAEKHGWGYGSTEIGTPRLAARTRSGEIVVEVYENFMDIEIPLEILENARSINLRGVRVRLIRPEEYLVLKARQGVDLDKLASYAKMLKRIDVKRIERTIEYYPPDEEGLIRSRLRGIGLKI